MAWLIRGEQVLASLEVADSFASRGKGLLGRDNFDGALLIKPARGIHTIGMRFAIDVAFCNQKMIVIDMVRMVPNRVGRIRLGARSIIEAQAGAFERWNLSVDDQLEVRA